MVRQTTTHMQRLDGTRLTGPVLGMSLRDADSSAPLKGRCVCFLLTCPWCFAVFLPLTSHEPFPRISRHFVAPTAQTCFSNFAQF